LRRLLGVAPPRPSATGYPKRRRWSRIRTQTHR
jgi:hypothetical protein